jgi:hypothetical protein
VSHADSGPDTAPVARRLAVIRAWQGSGMQRIYNAWVEHGWNRAQRLTSGTANKGCPYGRELWGVYLNAQD